MALHLSIGSLKTRSRLEPDIWLKDHLESESGNLQVSDKPAHGHSLRLAARALLHHGLCFTGWNEL